ncbi:hypothetical protein DFH08DRAFT_1085011 [Mycena albidolilacea]|uniref:Uncharacterized protein n=1 Tax=Mycena albidolilacea TaxID=1033008 RepID=A0AAD6ZJB4_9AGAR|nr:hypothetical protein DFH08DRAFT_1085011 [Mycena albidolilacea]
MPRDILRSSTSPLHHYRAIGAPDDQDDPDITSPVTQLHRQKRAAHRPRRLLYTRSQFPTSCSSIIAPTTAQAACSASPGHMRRAPRRLLKLVPPSSLLRVACTPTPLVIAAAAFVAATRASTIPCGMPGAQEARAWGHPNTTNGLNGVFTTCGSRSPSQAPQHAAPRLACAHQEDDAHSSPPLHFRQYSMRLPVVLVADPRAKTAVFADSICRLRHTTRIRAYVHARHSPPFLPNLLHTRPKHRVRPSLDASGSAYPPLDALHLPCSLLFLAPLTRTRRPLLPQSA